MNRQSKIDLLVIAGALCLLCLAAIPSETARTKALQRRHSLAPTEEHLVAAETSARQDRRNMIILRMALGIVFALDVFAIWKVARTEDEHGGQPPVSVSRPVAKLLLGTLKYFGAYLLGFFAGTIYANAVAPYDIGLDELFKFAALPTLMFGSLRGLYFFFQTALTEFPDLVLHAWWAVLILLIPFVCEAMVCCRRKSSFRFWRPLWIGFPVGFLGMLGAYWMALQSIP